MNIRPLAGELRMQQKLLASSWGRFQSKLVLYRLYRQVGNGRWVSWCAAESEVEQHEREMVRELADRFLFRMEVERDLQNLDLLT